MEKLEIIKRKLKESMPIRKIRKMDPERFKIKPPIGEARELPEAFKEWLLLFETVKNEVSFVNENFEKLPFKNLEKGKETPLGLFIKSAIPEIFRREPSAILKIFRREPREKTQRLEVWPTEFGDGTRSALLGRFILKDKQGNFYRDMDVKGVGYIERKTIEIPGERRRNGTFSGFLEKEWAEYDRDMSEKFISAGIRTVRTLAIIDLKEIIAGGKKISLDKAREMGIIERDFQPAIQVRAFGTRARIQDLFFNPRQLLLKDAIKFVSQELGRGDDPLSPEEYLKWFAETHGINVGLIHKNGLVHKGFHSHNVTLDCRTVDLDTVDTLKTKGESESDRDWALSCLETLISLAGFGDRVDKFRTLFNEKYDSVFPPAEREKRFSQ